MNKIINVEATFNRMRLDRFIRNQLGKLPQSLIEKYLRSGKIKLNNKKAKSSFKVKSGDRLYIYNFNFEQKINEVDKKFKPSNKMITQKNP